MQYNAYLYLSRRGLNEIAFVQSLRGVNYMKRTGKLLERKASIKIILKVIEKHRESLTVRWFLRAR